MVATVGTWIFCLYLFAFPEKAMNYKLLARLEKLEEIERFDINSVPSGKFFYSRELYKRFYHFDADQMEGANGKLKRSYLQNYEDEEPIFVKGAFRIRQVRKLGGEDYFQSGIVVQALPIEEIEQESASGLTKKRRTFPNAIFEFVLPSNAVPEALYQEGEELTLDTIKDFAALLHVERIGAEHLCFTAVPILYGNYKLSDGETIALAPPEGINVDAPWPVYEQEIEPPSNAVAVN